MASTPRLLPWKPRGEQSCTELRAFLIFMFKSSKRLYSNSPLGQENVLLTAMTALDDSLVAKEAPATGTTAEKAIEENMVGAKAD